VTAVERSEMELPQYRVAIVECHTLFAKALSAILAADSEFTVVGEYRSVVAKRLDAGRPDLIVLDIDGQAGNVERHIAVCAKLESRPRVCVLSIHSLPEVMQRCLSAGADAYIVKNISPAEVVSALKMVGRGYSYVDPSVAAGLLRKRSQNDGKRDSMELSLREMEVLKLIAKGLANKQISARLKLSERTVENHVGRIFAKLNVTARAQAAVHAIRNGIV